MDINFSKAMNDMHFLSLMFIIVSEYQKLHLIKIIFLIFIIYTTVYLSCNVLIFHDPVPP